MFFDHFNFAFMSTFEFKVVPAEGLFQEYFLRSFGSLQGQNLIDFQFYKRKKKFFLVLFYVKEVVQNRCLWLRLEEFGRIEKSISLKY